MTKQEMLNEMDRHCYDPLLEDDATYEEVKEAYEQMLDEFDAAYDDMYPNGRDEDAIDEDGL